MDVLAERIAVARAALEELEKTTRRLFDGIRFGDEAWPGEARAISALQSMTTVKSAL